MYSGKFKCDSVRLCRYLYGLGFDKESIYVDGKESWLFLKSDNLQECLDFFFIIRNKIRNK